MNEKDEKKENSERTFAMLCHLSALALFIGIPFGHLIGPLVIWLIKKDEFPLVEREGKEVLNFQLSMTIYFIASILLCFILIGFVFLAALAITELVLIIIASIKASNGESYHYPLTIRFLK